MSTDRKVPWPPSTGVFATYPLQCHCAAIQYTITISPPLLETDDPEGKGVYTALECDCTHCERKAIISCHPKLGDVKFSQGLVRSSLRNAVVANGEAKADRGVDLLTLYFQRSNAASTTAQRRSMHTGSARLVVCSI